MNADVMREPGDPTWCGRFEASDPKGLTLLARVWDKRVFD